MYIFIKLFSSDTKMQNIQRMQFSFQLFLHRIMGSKVTWRRFNLWRSELFLTQNRASYGRSFVVKAPLTLKTMGGAVGPPPSCDFLPFTQKSSGNPYLKIIDFSQLFISDAPMKKNSTNLVLSPRRLLLGHPVQKYLKMFCFNQKNLLPNPSWNYFLDII